MYITAHHVRTARGVVGINTFLHHHDADEVEGIGASIQFDKITQQNPGRLTAVRYEITPGGNTVLAYLDVICPDHTAPKAISAALGQARAALEGPARPLRRRLPGRIGIQFGATLGLDRIGERREFDTLSERVHALLLTPTPPPWEGQPPLIVEAETQGRFITLRLSADSQRRVAHPQELPLPAAALSLAGASIDATESAHGELLRAILPTLVGLPLEELARLGGVRLVVTPEQRLVWEWPRRVAQARAGDGAAALAL
jgi:hypothetical protein